MKTKWTEIIIVVVVLLLISVILDGYAGWDNDLPSDTQSWNIAAGKIRDNWDALEIELGTNLNEAHPYYQSAAPTTKPDGSTALDVDDNGRLWIDSDDNVLYILTAYATPTWTVAGAIASISSADTTFTLTNTDEEDSDGGRQSQFISKGEQSGGEATTLGYIEFNHDGTSDDHKGQFLIKLNDGDDSDTPSNQPIGYLSTGKIDVSASLSVLDEDDLSSDDDEVVATQQSIKAYVDADHPTYSGGESHTDGSGLIIKMGHVDDAGATTTVTFGTAFPAAIVTATISPVHTSHVDTRPIITAYTTSAITIKDSGSFPSGFNWIAIGY